MMNSFKSDRLVHEYTQSNPAAPEKVFPLLCPVREVDWLPGWQHRLIYSDSGLAELGCVFSTPNPPSSLSSSPETNWIVTHYDPQAFRIAFVWIDPGFLIAELDIHLAGAGPDRTHTKIRYRYTALSSEGNRQLESYDRKWFEARMENWERCINHYLCTGNKIAN
jgi:hypothetical protein